MASGGLSNCHECQGWFQADGGPRKRRCASTGAGGAAGATAGFLEYTGQGLGTFERAMDRDERLRAILGARLLETQERVGETAEAIELRVSGENSILGALAQSVGASMTQVLRWVYWWNSTEALPEHMTNERVVMELNTDFSTKGMSAPEIQVVVQAWQNGALSRDSMLDIFRRGEVLPEGWTNEEEVRLIAAGKPEVGAAKVSALRSQAVDRVIIGQRGDVVGVAADDGPEPLDPRDLILLRNGEVDNDRAMVVARVAVHVHLEVVENHVEPLIARFVNVDLVAGIPVDPEHLGKFLRIHDPFTVVSVRFMMFINCRRG